MELRVASIVEKSMQRINERSLSVTQPRAPDNVLVVRLDYARLIPSRTYLNFLCQVIRSLIALSTDEQSMIRRDIAALIPVLTTTGLTNIEGSSYALSGLAAAINPSTAIGLYMKTIVLYTAAYMIWRLIFRVTSSIPPVPGIDTKNTIVLIDILGLEVRLPLERCATFEASLCLFHMWYISGAHYRVAGFPQSSNRAFLEAAKVCLKICAITCL
jgi:hypothetical protein